MASLLLDLGLTTTSSTYNYTKGMNMYRVPVTVQLNDEVVMLSRSLSTGVYKLSSVEMDEALDRISDLRNKQKVLREFRKGE